jgi:hypothetical protein
MTGKAAMDVSGEQKQLLSPSGDKEREELDPCLARKKYVAALVLLASLVTTAGFCLVRFGFVHHSASSSGSPHITSPRPLLDIINESASSGMLQVKRGQKGFPSYWDYAKEGSSSDDSSILVVSYDKRSLLLNGDRVLFLGGSLHPVRATPATWEYALDEAVANGLNLVTIYVFWGAHQPFADQPLDWSLNLGPSDGTLEYDIINNNDKQKRWELADAIRSCASRGLFVHIRVGPYVCAEYTYGGIPEWLAIQHPTMQMRQLDPDWMRAMEQFVAATFAYLKANQLWSFQKGPIVMAQIENELGDNPDDDDDDDDTIDDGEDHSTASTHTKRTKMQEYAEWCGTMAASYAPNVVLTMCNGLSANNTIETHNGIDDSDVLYWLDQHGDNGRVQVNQPALWTEDEGGFQLWGDDPVHPNDYFWGRSARDMARTALQWFARGGSHLNYYMVRQLLTNCVFASVLHLFLIVSVLLLLLLVLLLFTSGGAVTIEGDLLLQG